MVETLFKCWKCLFIETNLLPNLQFWSHIPIVLAISCVLFFHLKLCSAFWTRFQLSRELGPNISPGFATRQTQTLKTFPANFKNQWTMRNRLARANSLWLERYLLVRETVHVLHDFIWLWSRFCMVMFYMVWTKFCLSCLLEQKNLWSELSRVSQNGFWQKSIVLASPYSIW